MVAVLAFALMVLAPATMMASDQQMGEAVMIQTVGSNLATTWEKKDLVAADSTDRLIPAFCNAIFYQAITASDYFRTMANIVSNPFTYVTDNTEPVTLTRWINDRTVMPSEGIAGKQNTARIYRLASANCA